MTEKPEYISKLEDDTFMMERTLYPLESMVTTEVITGLLSQSKVEKKYNAFDKDIAVIHFYFGKTTPWVRFKPITLYPPQSMKDP